MEFHSHLPAWTTQTDARNRAKARPAQQNSLADDDISFDEETENIAVQLICN
jgi:hypothetical protein